jgi:hypothetical protein
MGDYQAQLNQNNIDPTDGLGKLFDAVDVFHFAPTHRGQGRGRLPILSHRGLDRDIHIAPHGALKIAGGMVWSV